MAANRFRLTSLKLLQKYSACSACRVEKSLYCTKKPGNEELQSEKVSGFAKSEQKQTELVNEPEAPAKESSELFFMAKSGNEKLQSEKVSGFAKFDQKQEELLKEPEPPAKESPESFVSLLRNSNFMAMGDPIGKVVIGKIYHIVGNDLYIDFGWKFHTVCTAPERNKETYVVGRKVKLRIKDLELCTKFLGGEEEITLCEADCILLGLVNRPSPRQSSTEEIRKLLMYQIQWMNKESDQDVRSLIFGYSPLLNDLGLYSQMLDDIEDPDFCYSLG